MDLINHLLGLVGISTAGAGGSILAGIVALLGGLVAYFHVCMGKAEAEKDNAVQRAVQASVALDATQKADQAMLDAATLNEADLKRPADLKGRTDFERQ